MSLLPTKYYDNYDSQKRIDTIKKFIKSCPRNISFLWNNQHYINTQDEYNLISGQLIMEYCENLTWRPLTYETSTNEVYCYLVDQDNEISEFISSYEYADSFIQTKDDEVTEEEFNICSGQHFGKTSDQIVYDIIKPMIESEQEYNYNNYNNNNYKKSRSSKSLKYYSHKPSELYDFKEIVNNVESVYDNYYDKTDEEDITDKITPEYSEDPDSQYEFSQKGEKKKK
jgi:hypothetical protein